MSAPERIFADSNVLFSASLPSPNPYEAIWTLPGVEILTCSYSVEEVSRNLKRAEHRARLWRLVESSQLVIDVLTAERPSGVSLPTKDWPILFTAIAGRADILVTGDLNHFGPYYEARISGVLILSPRMLFDRYPSHFSRGAAKR